MRYLHLGPNTPERGRPYPARTAVAQEQQKEKNTRDTREEHREEHKRHKRRTQEKNTVS